MAKFNPRELLSTYGSIAALNSNFDDIAEILEQCVFRDGTAPNSMNAVLDMDHNQINNLGEPSNMNDAVRLQDIQNLVPEEALSATLATGAGASLIGTDNGQTLDRRLAAQPSIYQRADFTIASVDIFGDSFMLQPNPHTSGDSIGQKYADLLGVSATISATSGHTSADGQTAIFGASVTAADHNVCAFGQNDAQYLGTGDTRLRQDDLQRIQLANLAWLGKAADDNKITVADMTSAGTWTADADLSGAFKSTEVGAAKEAAFTDCRYAVVLYKAKVGSAGRFAIELESDDTNIPEFSAAPESGWVPTNTGQTWAVMARVFDFGAVLPSASVQFRVADGSGDVSIIAMVGFSGDPLTGPLLGIGDVSRRGAAGYATAVGSEVSVPIINRVIAQASAQALALGINAVDLPIASVLDVATDLAADEFHPSETGAVNVATAWQARVESAQGMGAARPDLLVQGFIQNSAGEIASGMALAMDDQRRIRFKRIGGSGIDLTGDREIRHTTGAYFVPVSAAGVPVSAAALVLTGDGNHNYLQTLIGDLVLGSAAGNKLRITNVSLRPETHDEISCGTLTHAFTYAAVNVGYYVGGVKVVGTQQAAIADATDAASAITQLNALLAAARAHGLIAT